jgi:PhnB protein
MSTPLAQPIPAGFNSLSDHLIVTDGLVAIAFYTKALGAQEVMRMMSPDGKALRHAQLKIGNSGVITSG